MRHSRQKIGAGAVLALVAAIGVNLEMQSIASAATASVTLTCAPTDPAVKKALQDNEATLASLAPGVDLKNITLVDTVDYTVPSTSTPGSNLNLSFSHSVAVPNTLTDLMVGLGVTTVVVKNASAPVRAVQNGTTLTTIAGTIPDTTATLTRGTGVTVAGGPFTGTLSNVAEGTITYTGGDVTFDVTGDLSGSQFLAAIQGLVPALLEGGATGTTLKLGLTCTSGTIATTSVAAPGSPVITTPPTSTVSTNTGASINLSNYIAAGVTGGRTVPIVPGSLALTGDTAGFSLNGNTISYAGSNTPGTYTVNYRVCGQLVTAGSAAVNEKQTLAFTWTPSTTEDAIKAVLPAAAQNLLPAGALNGLLGNAVSVTEFKLTVDGDETAAIPVTSGQPTLASLQSAVDAAVGAGEVIVSETTSAAGLKTFTFDYSGSLAATNVPQVTVSSWKTQPDATTRTAVKAATALSNSWSDLFNTIIDVGLTSLPEATRTQLRSQISTVAPALEVVAPFNTVRGQVPAIVDAAFPTEPTAATVTDGAAATTATDTGLLCSTGTWSVVVTAASATGSQATTTTTSTTTTTTTTSTTVPTAVLGATQVRGVSQTFAG